MEPPAQEPFSGVTRWLCEELAERLQATGGKWTLELHLSDGRVTKVRRHDETGGADLELFDPPAV